MENTFKVVLLILLPLVWGLGVEFIFERIRRKRGGGKNSKRARS